MSKLLGSKMDNCMTVGYEPIEIGICWFSMMMLLHNSRGSLKWSIVWASVGTSQSRDALSPGSIGPKCLVTHSGHACTCSNNNRVLCWPISKVPFHFERLATDFVCSLTHS